MQIQIVVDNTINIQRTVQNMHMIDWNCLLFVLGRLNPTESVFDLPSTGPISELKTHPLAPFKVSRFNSLTSR